MLLKIIRNSETEPIKTYVTAKLLSWFSSLIKKYKNCIIVRTIHAHFTQSKIIPDVVLVIWTISFDNYFRSLMATFWSVSKTRTVTMLSRSVLRLCRIPAVSRYSLYNSPGIVIMMARSVLRLCRIPAVSRYSLYNSPGMANFNKSLIIFYQCHLCYYLKIKG